MRSYFLRLPTKLESLKINRIQLTPTLQASICEIATIHQVYRVHLWLALYKLYFAQQIQVEFVALSSALVRIVIQDKFRQA